MHKQHGITHVVHLHGEVYRAAFNDPFIEHVQTTCGALVNLPWRNASRIRPSRIDCMGCLVALGRS